jgi:hypothetical protein
LAALATPLAAFVALMKPTLQLKVAFDWFGVLARTLLPTAAAVSGAQAAVGFAALQVDPD